MNKELDKKFVIEMQNQFFDECEELFAVAESSLMEMEKSSDSRHLASFLRCLHSIKGGARAVGFDSLTIFSHSFETYISKSHGKFDFRLLFQALDLLIKHIQFLRLNKVKEADQILKNFAAFLS